MHILISWPHLPWNMARFSECCLTFPVYGSQVTFLGFLFVEKCLEKETLCKSMKCQLMEFKSNLKPQLQ